MEREDVSSMVGGSPKYHVAKVNTEAIRFGKLRGFKQNEDEKHDARVNSKDSLSRS